jgi:uncharacterized membrane protein YraQ (UPF0718 family)
VDYQPLILIFTSIIYEALPFIVLGVLLAGLLEEFVPQQMIARLVPRSRALHTGAIAVGGLLGLIFPMCECGIIPVMRRLLRKGVPLSVCLCYMLAGPIINLVVMTSTWVAFSKSDLYGGPYGVVAMRVGLGFVVAFITSLIVDWQQRKYGNAALLVPVVAHEAERHGDDPAAAPVQRRSWLRSLGNITETALHDFVDIMAFLVLGALIASVARVLIPQIGFDEFIKKYPLSTIPLMMLFAILFCLCSEADAFVAANFQPIDLWLPASKMAFLVLGPMLDLKLLLMYTRVFRRRLIVTIVLSLVVQVFVYTTLLHYFWPAPPSPSSSTSSSAPAVTGSRSSP